MRKRNNLLNRILSYSMRYVYKYNDNVRYFSHIEKMEVARQVG